AATKPIFFPIPLRVGIHRPRMVTVLHLAPWNSNKWKGQRQRDLSEGRARVWVGRCGRGRKHASGVKTPSFWIRPLLAPPLRGSGRFYWPLSQDCVLG